MKITSIKDNCITLHDIDCGAVFKYNDKYYMKLRYEYTEDLPQYENGASPTVVCLEDGNLVCFAETAPIEVIDAELRVKE